jgi:hypothetical protein
MTLRVTTLTNEACRQDRELSPKPLDLRLLLECIHLNPPRYTPTIKNHGTPSSTMLTE